MSEKTPKQKAIEKTQSELSKDVNEVILFAGHTGLGELLFFLHALHIVRIIGNKNEVPEAEKEAFAVITRQATDAYKYLIQVLYKHGKKRLVEYKASKTYINPDLVSALTHSVTHINSKYETLSMLTLFNDSDIEVSGERDQFLKMNLDNITKDERLNKFFQYAVRADRENDLQRDNMKTKNDFLLHFKAEYQPYEDLFEISFGVNLDTFINTIDFILDSLQKQMMASEDRSVKLENGRIDVQAYGTIMAFGNSLFLEKKTIFEKFGAQIQDVLTQLTFQTESFDEHQLMYNLVARQPIFEHEDHFLISPELLLDSLFVNSHYSLLETSKAKEEYKKRYATIFVDKIVETAKKFGYYEVTRELELYEGKDQIGDIDLVLKNDNNHFILVEAKNHAIPMDVYFHDHPATEKRLNDLTNQWEKKVNRRLNNITINHAKYGIASTFNYLIISKSPEILSHFSKHLVLTINEFEYWLNQNNPAIKFDDFFEEMYQLNKETLTPEQMNSIQENLKTGWRFEKE
jgi:hypothetical protein